MHFVLPSWKMNYFGSLKRGLGTRALGALRDIPGPSSFPLVGALPHYLPPIGKYDPQRVFPTFLSKYKEFGPLFKESMFGKTVVYLVDPDDIQALIQQNRGEDNWPERTTHVVLEHVRNNELKKNGHKNGGIFMTNGEKWAEIRQTFQKSMNMSDEIAKFVPIADNLASKIISDINSPSVAHLLETDFLHVIFSYTTDYMGLILFGEEWNTMTSVLDPDSLPNKLIYSSTELNHATGPTDHGAGTWRYLSTPSYKLILSCAKILDDVCISRMEQRLVDGVLVAQEGNPSLLDTWIRAGVDNNQLLTFLSDSILAGIDTMGYSLSFIIYHLSVNPEAQEKLWEELRTLNVSCRGMEEKLTKASYLKKCVKEALRLNPLAVGIGRTLTQDWVLRGYHLPRGTNIVTLNQVTSRLPEWVESPDDFIPERYESGSKWGRIHPFVSIPFSHGARSCVGRRLAEQAMNIFLFRLFSQWEVSWTGDKPLDCVTSLINRPDAPLKFSFKARPPATLPQHPTN